MKKLWILIILISVLLCFLLLKTETSSHRTKISQSALQQTMPTETATINIEGAKNANTTYKTIVDWGIKYKITENTKTISYKIIQVDSEEENAEIEQLLIHAPLTGQVQYPNYSKEIIVRSDKNIFPDIPSFKTKKVGDNYYWVNLYQDEACAETTSVSFSRCLEYNAKMDIFDSLEVIN